MWIAILSTLLLGLTILYGLRMYADTRLHVLLRTYLRQADKYKPGGRDTVVIPYNELASKVNWKSDNYPMRTDKFTSKPGKHPASVSPVRRAKMKGI